jgi:hypothetical protein
MRIKGTLEETRYSAQSTLGWAKELILNNFIESNFKKRLLENGCRSEGSTAAMQTALESPVPPELRTGLVGSSTSSAVVVPSCLHFAAHFKCVA